MASLRFSSHFLNVERLRRVRPHTELANRLFPACAVIEDERHAFLHCQEHIAARNRLRNKLIGTQLDWSKLR